MTAIYNEIDPYAAQWLRNLIAAGHIAKGTVDERRVETLESADVAGPGQRHFFAGIGVWSHALRLAGWPDDRDIWTGSCPCQPFSAAGRGLGVDDERHLWPEWFRLIRECRPGVVVGEQVASPAGLGWFDAVSADLEGAGYAVGAVDLCAAGVGAPHIRQRLFFVAVAYVQPGDVHAAERQQGRGVPDTRGSCPAGGVCDCGHGPAEHDFGDGDCNVCSCTGFVADAPAGGRHQGRADGKRCGGRGDARNDRTGPADDGSALALADAERNDRPGRIGGSYGRSPLQPDRHRDAGQLGNTASRSGIVGVSGGSSADVGREPAGSPRQPAAAAGTAGFWHPADWIACADGRARPVEPGTFPLAHRSPARVGRLRAYGNAIVAPLAAEFIRAVMETT